MDHVVRNPAVSKKLAEIPAVEGPRDVLNKFHGVPVGVVHFETEVAVELRLEFWRDFEPATGHISPQRLNVAGLEGDVGEPVFGGALEFSEHLDVLVVVHLEIGEHQAAARLVHREGLLKSQGAAVKNSPRGQVVRSDADNSNTD